MTLFQILSISFLILLFLRELVEARRDAIFLAARWLRGLVWLCAAAAIARPDLVQALAESVGINRGADLVFYLFVLAFLGAAFYFYSRLVRTQRQITQLVRYLALEQAKRGSGCEE